MALDNTQISNYTDKTTIKNWFKTGLKPTQTQFWSTWDSFWHKSESLPISSITNLGNLLDGKAESNHTHDIYATNDATSLTTQNITQWQNKLGINDLDYVVIPTEDATENSHPYVVVIDAEGKSAKRKATDFGKVDTVMGVSADVNKNVDISGVSMNWTNPSQRFSALPDKSADATYNIFSIFDSNGNLAKASKPFFAFKNFLNQNSIVENLELSQLLNGGQGSGQAISVASIMPRLFPLENNNTTIILNGAGLLLNVTDFRLDILKEDGTILTRVPNAQITFINDNQLKFYYNFSALGIGKFKFKITSGVRVHITTVSYQVVNNVEYLDTSTITWQKLFANDYTTNSKTVAVGATITHENELKTIASASVKCALKSSQLFAQGEDFLIEIDLNISKFTGNAYDNLSTMLQLCYSSTQNVLANYGISKLLWGTISGYGNFISAPIAVFIGNIISENNVDKNRAAPYSNILTIVKQGNEIAFSCGSKSYYTTIQNNSGYALSVQIPYRQTDEVFSINVLKAYKIID